MEKGLINKNPHLPPNGTTSRVFAAVHRDFLESKWWKTKSHLKKKKKKWKSHSFIQSYGCCMWLFNCHLKTLKSEGKRKKFWCLNCFSFLLNPSPQEKRFFRLFLTLWWPHAVGMCSVVAMYIFTTCLSCFIINTTRLLFLNPPFSQPV